MILKALSVFAFLPGAALAQTLSFPGNAVMTGEDAVGIDSFALPIGPWVDQVLPTKTYEGDLTRQAWRIPATGLTTLQILRPLREQLRNAGYDIAFECDTEGCGGFDFRFALDVMLPPQMQVDLAAFRYLSATRDDIAIGLLVSRTSDAGFVQVTRIGPATQPIAATDAPIVAMPGTTAPGTDLATALRSIGRFVLSDLAFETGSSQLGPGPFESLQQLADFLASEPALQVALVGHTDSSGSLDGNIALSKRRAGSVLERLVTDYGVSRSQIEAQGMGYLAPIAHNQTEEGREANRRVEVIVTSSQ